jgi:hypothetical protein
MGSSRATCSANASTEIPKLVRRGFKQRLPGNGPCLMRIETSWINRVVPAPLRRALRTAHRQRVFRRAVGDLRGLSAEEDPSEELLSALVYGWGNSAWSALGPYLTVLRRHALETDEEIVECGAGLSTIVLAVACEARPSAIVSLEHDPNWHHVVCNAPATT